MTILENNLHLKPRQTRGTELFRFRNYIALTVVSVSTLIGLAFHYSKLGRSALEHNKQYVRDLDVPNNTRSVEMRSKSPADMLLDYVESIEAEKYY
ncbi:hypothetical protein LSTR_LSTR015689 [Laodelphax striatellus]|uniref:Uncharacterized protein n=1 Tax=Laodelphax striatellus TaxID=195883 RepID=A0A482WZZ3_LAOST|nr:hypothetical protein LSTR_LSTR015689 [Laodelphax striatellus]